jgi:hypothetical protein
MIYSQAAGVAPVLGHGSGSGPSENEIQRNRSFGIRIKSLKIRFGTWEQSKKPFSKCQKNPSRKFSMYASAIYVHVTSFVEN